MVAYISVNSQYSQIMKESVESFREAADIVVLAAGSDNADACNFSPASETKLLTVVWTIYNDERS